MLYAALLNSAARSASFTAARAVLGSQWGNFTFGFSSPYSELPTPIADRLLHFDLNKNVFFHDNS